jgi:hypothetical protein
VSARQRKAQSTLAGRKEALARLGTVLRLIPTMTDGNIVGLITQQQHYEYNRGQASREEMVCKLAWLLAEDIVDA